MAGLPVKILHTSDWHIGRSLYGRKRYEEFEAFLNWLAQTIEDKEIDALLVAGDIFDTSTPSNRAQELYYRFLTRVAASSCRHVVIVAGNHDSPSFLNAPKQLLRVLDVYVVGSSNTESPQDEVLVLSDKQGAAELIVCAVPYLRDKDIRAAEAGESAEDKERKLIEGIRTHYAAVASVAEQHSGEHGSDIPVVAMGHLFTAGGQTIDGDGVRDLYVGSTPHVTAGVFPATFDYLALGHLHVPQKVNNSETMRYSGSPLPMGFGEVKQQKSLCQVEFNGTVAAVQLIDVPVFQRLESIKGDWGSISSRILELLVTDTSCWLEVVYEGDEVIGDLRERLEDLISGNMIFGARGDAQGSAQIDKQSSAQVGVQNGAKIEILRIKNNRIIDRVLGQTHVEETLDDLNVTDVFTRCLIAHDVPEDQRPQLLQSYSETVASLYEDDTRAE